MGRDACGAGVGIREEMKRAEGGRVTKTDKLVTEEDLDYLYFNLKLSN